MSEGAFDPMKPVTDSPPDSASPRAKAVFNLAVGTGVGIVAYWMTTNPYISTCVSPVAYDIVRRTRLFEKFLSVCESIGKDPVPASGPQASNNGTGTPVPESSGPE